MQPRAQNTLCNEDTFKSLGLSNIQILNLNISAAYNLTYIPNPSITPTDGSALGTTVNMCSINLRYTHPGQNDTINTSIGLPLDSTDWNGRFLMEGGGGWVTSPDNGVQPTVAAGYSSSSTDGGHTENGPNWGLASEGNTDWPALSDFASVALVEAARLGKQATFLYYGQEASFSYWTGCSTGGRQGHMMAQRYPEEFDGIAAGCPAINWQRFLIYEYWPVLIADSLGMSRIS